MTRTGHWFNLETLSFEAFAPLTWQPLAPLTNAIWSFRGAPTVFGAPSCDDTFTCNNTNVVRYDSDQDEWMVIGYMSTER